MNFKIILSLSLASFLCISAFSQNNTSKKIEELISKKRTYHKEHKSTPVFIIQLYNGNEQKAYAIKNKFVKLYSNYKAIITYKLPEWKVQAGYFYTKLEADVALNNIKKHFNSAIVLEDKI